MRVLQIVCGKTELKDVYFGAQKVEVHAQVFPNVHFHEFFEDPSYCLHPEEEKAATGGELSAQVTVN